MKKILLISPHFDDAVLSAGQYMADRADADVVTVFGGFPITASHVKTPYDKKCGFTNAKDAVVIRRLENEHALALLEARPINLEFPDSQYENQYANKVSVNDIVKELQEIVDRYDYEYIMAPMGLGHPDHIKTTEAVKLLQTDKTIYFWEDIPLRVVEPEIVWDRVMQLGLKRDQIMIPATTGDKMAKKIRAMLCYKSQVNTGILDPYVMYVPERFWKYK